MNDLIEQLRKEETELIIFLEEINKSLKKSEGLPEGRLRISGNGKATQYYLCRPDLGTGGKYLCASKQGIVPGIAQRDFDLKAKRMGEKKLKGIHRFLKNYVPKQISDYYNDLCTARKNMIDPHFITDEMFVEQWLSAPFRTNPMAEGKIFHSERGEFVRSKSEKILADKFLSLGIPYKYECAVQLPGGKIFYPDFTLLNVRLRKEYILEHLGMIDDEDYCVRAMEKLRSYTQAGILPGKKLLITFESKEVPLDMRQVDLLIQTYLL